MSRLGSFSEWFLRQPLVWGGLACWCFYLMLSQGWIESELVQRYFATHEVEYVTTVLFFVAMAALAMRTIELTIQYTAVRRSVLSPIPTEGQEADEAHALLNELTVLPDFLQESYLVRRLRDALEYVRRKGTAADLDQHLWHLGELDAGRMSAGYTMVRVIIWAIPILGFLGTVIGITLAIAQLSPEKLEGSLLQVTSGLGVAFDTTALALALSLALMFVKSCVERVEEKLLNDVDARVAEELVGRFRGLDIGNDPNVATIRRMSEQVVESVEELAARQAQLWKSTIDESHQQWARVTSSAGGVLEAALSSSVQEGLQRYTAGLTESTRAHSQAMQQAAEETAQRMGDGLSKLGQLLMEGLQQHGESLKLAEQEIARENRLHLGEVEAAVGEAMVLAADRQERLIGQSEKLLERMYEALSESSSVTIEHQQELVKQGEVLLKIVTATGQVKELENTLAKNLATLAASESFHTTLESLSGAAQQLSRNLGPRPRPTELPPIILDDSDSNAA